METPVNKHQATDATDATEQIDPSTFQVLPDGQITTNSDELERLDRVLMCRTPAQKRWKKASRGVARRISMFEQRDTILGNA